MLLSTAPDYPKNFTNYYTHLGPPTGTLGPGEKHSWRIPGKLSILFLGTQKCENYVKSGDCSEKIA
jgi:hypothetical protein